MSTSPPPLASQESRRSPVRAVVVEPRLYVLARPSLDQDCLDFLLEKQDVSWRRTDGATDAEDVVEFAGRICYFSFGERQSSKTNGEYIGHLVKQGHESVLEHANWTFALTGVSRAFSHQFVRHRIGFSFSQLSQQYHDESDAPAVMPRAIARAPRTAKKWLAAFEASIRTYRDLLAELEDSADPIPDRERLRLLRTSARSVLPAATETKLVFTANARALRHFLFQRGAILGDEEMRLVSALLFTSLESEAPSLVADLCVEELRDGLPVVRPRTR